MYINMTVQFLNQNYTVARIEGYIHMPLIYAHIMNGSTTQVLFSAPALPFIARVAWTQPDQWLRSPLTNIPVVVAQCGFSVGTRATRATRDPSTAEVELLDEEEAEQAKLSRCCRWLKRSLEYSLISINGDPKIDGFC